MNSEIKPAEHVHLLLLGDQGVLFDQSSQKIFHLNASATLIWSQLTSAIDEQVRKHELQQVFAFSEAEAVAYLQATYQLFKDLGVLTSAEKTAENLAQDPDLSQVLKQQLDEKTMSYDDQQFIAERHYCLLSSFFRLRFSTSIQLSIITPILQHLHHQETNGLTPINLDIIANQDGSISVCRDNKVLLCCANNSQLAPIVKSLVWQLAVNTHHYFLNIHAGVVSDGQCCYLFPASSGSGKSTLTAALVKQGFTYYSDEAALLHEPDFSVEPVPLAICVKSTGVKVLSKYYPDIATLAVHDRSDGKKVRYMQPPSVPLNNANNRQTVAAIIFPHYCQSATTKLETIASVDALQQLMQECLVVDKPLTLNNVTNLLTWIEHTPCYTLTIANLEEALQLVQQLSSQEGQ